MRQVIYEPNPTCNAHKEQEGFGSDRKSTRLNSSHTVISYAVFCLKKKNTFRNSFSKLFWLVLNLSEQYSYFLTANAFLNCTIITLTNQGYDSHQTIISSARVIPA